VAGEWFGATLAALPISELQSGQCGWELGLQRRHLAGSWVFRARAQWASVRLVELAVGWGLQ